MHSRTSSVYNGGRGHSRSRSKGNALSAAASAVLDLAPLPPPPAEVIPLPPPNWNREIEMFRVDRNGSRDRMHKQRQGQTAGGIGAGAQLASPTASTTTAAASASALSDGGVMYRVASTGSTSRRPSLVPTAVSSNPTSNPASTSSPLTNNTVVHSTVAATPSVPSIAEAPTTEEKSNSTPVGGIDTTPATSAQPSTSSTQPSITSPGRPLHARRPSYYTRVTPAIDSLRRGRTASIDNGTVNPNSSNGSSSALNSPNPPRKTIDIEAVMTENAPLPPSTPYASGLLYRRPSQLTAPNASVVDEGSIRSGGLLRGISTIMESVYRIEVNSALGSVEGSPVEILHHALGAQGRKDRTGDMFDKNNPELKQDATEVASLVLEAVPPPPASSSMTTPTTGSAATSANNITAAPNTSTAAATAATTSIAAGAPAVSINTSTTDAKQPPPIGSPSSKLLKQLVDAKLTPGMESDTVRQMQMDFDAAKEEARQLKNDCIRIIQQPLSDRNDNDRQKLLHWMRTQKSVLLKELSTNVLEKLCEKVVFQTAKAGTIVFKQGAPSDAFYIIVTGLVSIWINPPQAPASKSSFAGSSSSTAAALAAANDEDAEVFNHGDEAGLVTNSMTVPEESSDEDVDEEKEQYESSGGNGSSGNENATSGNDNNGNNGTSTPSGVKRRKSSLQSGGGGTDSPSTQGGNRYRRPIGSDLPSNVMFVGTMAAGEEKCAFGELGLVSGEPRSATIKCEQYTELLVVRKDDFHTVLKKYSEQLKRRVALIRSFPEFYTQNHDIFASAATNQKGAQKKKKRGLSTDVLPGVSLLTTQRVIIGDKYLRKLSLFFREVTIKGRTTVFEQGSTCDKIYFLIEGEVELLQNALLPTGKPNEPMQSVQIGVTRIRADIPDHIKAMSSDSPTNASSGGGSNTTSGAKGASDQSSDEQVATEGKENTAAVLDAAKGNVLPSIHSPTASSFSSPSGQILGESPLFIKSLRNCYDYTLRTCSGNCVFYVMKREDFLRRMNYILLSRFQARLKEKMQWRQRRLEAICAPKLANGSNASKDGSGSNSASSSLVSTSLTLAASQASAALAALSDEKNTRGGRKGKKRNQRAVNGALIAPILSHAPPAQSYSNSSWSSLRQQQLQLASHKNLRLLPTLTESSRVTPAGSILPSASSSSSSIAHSSSSATVASHPDLHALYQSSPTVVVESVSVLEEAALPMSPRSFQRRVAAAAKARVEEAKERERLEKRLAQKRANLLAAHPPPPSAGSGPQNVTNPPPSSSTPLDAAFSSGENRSPLVSTSRSIIQDVNPTMRLTRRGSTGLAPHLRPFVPLSVLQITNTSSDASSSSSLAHQSSSSSGGNVSASADSAKILIPMPHSVPHSLPADEKALSIPAQSIPPSAPSSLREPLRANNSSGSGGRGHSLSPARGGHSLSPSRDASPARPQFLPPPIHRAIDATTGRVQLTAEQHLVLSTQLRSTDAATRAKKIVSVMREMKERNQDWVITRKSQHPDDANFSADEYHMAAAGGGGGDSLSLVPLPLDSAREMWQLRETKREKKRRAAMSNLGNGKETENLYAAIDHENAAHAHGHGSHSARPLGSSASSTSLNGSYTGNEMNHSARESSSKIYDGEGHTISLAHDAQQRMKRNKEAQILGKLNPHIHLTPSLVADISLIAPKSSVLQQAWQIGSQSHHTHTHKAAHQFQTKKEKERDLELLQTIDWPLLVSSTHGAANPFLDLATLQRKNPGANQHNTTNQSSMADATLKQIRDMEMNNSEVNTDTLLARAEELKRSTLEAKNAAVQVAAAAGPAAEHFHLHSMFRPPVHSDEDNAQFHTERVKRREEQQNWLKQLLVDPNTSNTSVDEMSPKVNTPLKRAATQLEHNNSIMPLQSVRAAEPPSALQAHNTLTHKVRSQRKSASTLSKPPASALLLKQHLASPHLEAMHLYVPYDPEKDESSLVFSHSATQFDRSDKGGYQPQVRYR